MFLAVDPFEGFLEQPYTQHSYAYALSNPVLYKDPTGKYFDDGDGGYGYEKEYRNCQELGGSWNWQQGLCYVDLRPSKPGLEFLDPARDATQHQQCPHGTIEHQAPDRVRYCVPIGMPLLLPEPSWWQSIQKECATIWDGVPSIVFANDDKNKGEEEPQDSQTSGAPPPSSGLPDDPSSLRNIYKRKIDAPNWPNGFSRAGNPITVRVKNPALLEELRKVESGQWVKVYENGTLPDGRHVSVHYFRSPSGLIFNLKVKPGWS